MPEPSKTNSVTITVGPSYENLSLHYKGTFPACGQTVSPTSGKIDLNPKGRWIRALTITSLLSLIVLYNYFGSIHPKEQPIMLYTTFVISLSILIFIIGWKLYRNPSSVLPKSHEDRGTVIHDGGLVSVIVPIYNQKEMTEIVIDSIFRSTYRNIEVIAVNDGSTDGTDKVLDSLKAEKYPQLKAIHKKNSGKRKAVASGFKESKGEYVILIDSDSIINSNAIEEFVKVFSSDPNIGAAAGLARVLNADKSLITKCQDAWYDYEYNIYKTCESYFGSVTCCSGCLAGYRREAIEKVLSIWGSEDNNNLERNNINGLTHDLENISNQNWIKKILLSKIYSLYNSLMVSLLNYDDSEDRALTTYCLMRWKSVYISTAVVHTEVPEQLRSFIRQQQRWKKGHLRANLFASTFFWSKNKPLSSLLFYSSLLMTVISPVIMVLALCYGVFILEEPIAPISLVAGYFAIGTLEGLDYKMRDPNAKYWKYRPLMSVVLSFVISWLIYSAIINYKKNVWLTR